jgi:hypothetical protein
MIVVTIELLPGGRQHLRKSIATMHISNVSELADVSDYEVKAMEGPNHLAGTQARIAECLVVNHLRRQDVWALLQAAAAELRTADWVEL